MLKRLIPSDFTVTFTRKSIFLKDIEEVHSSARYFQDRGLRYKKIEIASKAPNVWVILTSKESFINAQRIYDKGEDLAKIDETVRELQKYIDNIAS